MTEMENDVNFDRVRRYWLRKNIAYEKPGHIVLKITDDCNLNCRYCYSSGGAGHHTMPVELAVSLFDQVAEQNSMPLTCCFHGGEPLLYPALLTEIAETLSEKHYYPRIHFTLQTNGTLITEDAIQFLKKYHIHVGISLDGLRDANDIYRVDRAGNSTYDRVMHGVSSLRENQLGFGFLCVVTKGNVRHIVDFLEWCMRTGVHNVALSYFYPSGYGAGMDFSPDLDELSCEMERVIDWLIEINAGLKPNERFYIREIESYANNVIHPGNCMYMCNAVPCGAGTKHISLACNGNVQVCDCLIGHSDYTIGNLYQSPLDEILQNPIVARFQERKIENIRECAECGYKAYCNGGCPATNISYYGEDGWRRAGYFCPFYKRMYQKILAVLENTDVSLLVSDKYLKSACKKATKAEDCDEISA